MFDSWVEYGYELAVSVADLRVLDLVRGNKHIRPSANH